MMYQRPYRCACCRREWCVFAYGWWPLWCVFCGCLDVWGGQPVRLAEAGEGEE